MLSRRLSRVAPGLLVLVALVTGGGCLVVAAARVGSVATGACERSAPVAQLRCCPVRRCNRSATAADGARLPPTTEPPAPGKRHAGGVLPQALEGVEEPAALSEAARGRCTRGLTVCMLWLNVII